jgi:hypothetical protein
VPEQIASSSVPARRSAGTDCFFFRACTPKCRNRLLLLPWLVGSNCRFAGSGVPARRRGWWGAIAASQEAAFPACPAGRRHAGVAGDRRKSRAFCDTGNVEARGGAYLSLSNGAE